MKLDRLSIQSQAGTLSLQSHNASLNTSPPTLDMKMQGNVEQVIKIQTNPPRLSIDQSDSFESVGVGPSFRWTDAQIRRAVEEGKKSIDRIVSDGVHYLRAKPGGKPTVELAKQKMARLYSHEIGVGAIQPAKVSYTPSSAESTAPLEHTLQTDWDYRLGTQDYTKGEVSVGWRTRPSISISVIPGEPPRLPPSTGSQIDTTL